MNVVLWWRDMDGLDRVWVFFALFAAVINLSLAFADVSPQSAAVRVGGAFSCLGVAFARRGINAKQEDSAMSSGVVFTLGGALGAFACAAVLWLRSQA